MYDPVVSSGWEVILFAILSVGVLMLSFFRLDELLASSKRKENHWQAGYGLDRHGNPVLCDPDGRTWSKTGRRK